MSYPWPLGHEELTKKPWSLLLLRLTIGALLVWWGLDKLVHVDHGVEVAQHFYFGLGASRPFLQAFGVVETALGLLIMLGWGRRWTYPLLLLITGVTLVGVWRSVVDPWGWVFAGSNALFYPSAIIFAGSLVLWAFRDTDRLALDATASSQGHGSFNDGKPADEAVHNTCFSCHELAKARDFVFTHYAP